MSKFVVETVQVIKRKYYVDVKDVEWAYDGITMEELEHFSSTHLSEDIISATLVEEFPKASLREDVNAATMKYNYERSEWEHHVRWDLSNRI